MATIKKAQTDAKTTKKPKTVSQRIGDTTLRDVKNAGEDALQIATLGGYGKINNALGGDYKYKKIKQKKYGGKVTKAKNGVGSQRYILHLLKWRLDYSLHFTFRGLFNSEFGVNKSLTLRSSFRFAKSRYVIFNSIRELHIGHTAEHISLQRLIELTSDIASLNFALFDVIHCQDHIFNRDHAGILQ